MDCLRISIKRQQRHYIVQQWTLNNLVVLYTRNVHRPEKFQPVFLLSSTITVIASLQQCPLQTKEQDRQCTIHVTQTRSWNNRCLGKTIIITRSECVCSLNYPTYKAHAPNYILICGLFGCTKFSHFIS
jgi:hypothetical protein